MNTLTRLKKPQWFVAGFIIAGILMLVFAFSHEHVGPEAKLAAVWVETQTVERGSIPVEIQAVGSLVAEKQLTITSDMPGHISKLLFKDGSFVTQGASLIQLDDAIAQAQLASARANFDFSNITYQRREKLGKKGLWPLQEIDQAKADLAEKRAVLQEREAMVAKLRLVAPFDGVLGKAKVSSGHYVTPGQALVSLTDIQLLRAEFSVSESYLSALKQGQTVKITTSAYPDKVFEGKIAYISPTIEAADRSISLYAQVPNPDHLLTAGMSVSIKQALGLQANAILVPAKSIMATLDGQQVYKVVNHKVYATPVLLGQRSENKVEILEGLSLKDVIVVSGQQKLHDGMDVQWKESELKRQA